MFVFIQQIHGFSEYLSLPAQLRLSEGIILKTEKNIESGLQLVSLKGGGWHLQAGILNMMHDNKSKQNFFHHASKASIANLPCYKVVYI